MQPMQSKTTGRVLGALLLSGLLSFLTGSPGAELRVVTTTPGLADVVREIGGERVQVESLTRGAENMHAVSLRPSMLVKLKKADLLVLQGLDLELTWLPDFQMRASNPKTAAGAPGYLDCSEGWTALNVPQSLSRKGGDLHPRGNPHYNLDPRAGRQFADRVCERLLQLDPEGAELFEARHAAYGKRLVAVEEQWVELAERTRGTKVIQYHQEFDYLLQALGIESVASIEPQPGIPPTPRHLAEVVATMKRDGVHAILTAPWSNNRQVESLAEQTGAAIVELPALVGGAEWASTWIDLMNGLHDRVSAQCAPARGGE